MPWVLHKTCATEIFGTRPNLVVRDVLSYSSSKPEWFQYMNWNIGNKHRREREREERERRGR